MANETNSKTGKSLSQVIEAIVRESIKSQLYKNAVDEKERQQHMLGEEDDDLFSDEDAATKDAETADDKEKPETSKTADDEKEKLQKGEITSDDVVEKLNAIRSGKSFKDEAISSKLSEYVESLSKPERTALLAFLKGLAQIVTGEVPAEQAIEPASKPANVKMQKGDAVQKKSIKPNVIKAPSKDVKEKPAAEDTSAPVPITPKKK